MAGIEAVQIDGGADPAQDARPAVPLARRAADRPEERLIEAGRRLFCREGIHATGITRLLEEAGVSRKTLYERFGSKEQLVRAVLEREGALWRRWFLQELQHIPGGAEAQLRGVFDVLARWFAAEDFFGCVFVNAVAEHDKLAAPVADLALAHRNQTNGILLKLAVEAGLEAPEDVVEKLSLLIDGAIVTAMITRSGKPALHAGSAAQQILAAHRPATAARGAGTTAGQRQRHGSGGGAYPATPGDAY